MADIRSRFLGIESPNPFWLASAPPTDKEINVTRAFEAGWGGVVWKTLGEDPHVVNVNGPRYATLMSQDRRVIGLNNIGSHHRPPAADQPGRDPPREAQLARPRDDRLAHGALRGRKLEAHPAHGGGRGGRRHRRTSAARTA